MEKPEYLILEYALQMYIPLTCLSASNITEMFNREHHDLSRPELVKLLCRMFDDRDLVAIGPGESEPRPEDWLTPTEEQIRAALDGRLDLSYRLTARGGRRWEEASRPDWSRHVVFDMHAGSEMQDITVASIDRRRLEEAMVMSGLFDLRLSYIDLRTLVWDTVGPWKATYWKTLPAAHRARYRGFERSIRWRSHMISNHFCSAFREWFYAQGWWYQPPFYRRRHQPPRPDKGGGG